MIAIKINDPKQAVLSRLPAIAGLLLGDTLLGLDDRKAEELILSKFLEQMGSRGITGTGAIIDDFDLTADQAIPDSTYVQLVIQF